LHPLRGLAQHREIHRFTSGLIGFRRAHPERFYTDADSNWFGPLGVLPAWDDPVARELGCLIHESDTSSLYLMFNADTEQATFQLSGLPTGQRWHLAADTSYEPAEELYISGEERLLAPTQAYHVGPRGSAILLARPPAPKGWTHSQ
jgi:glycogen operon protein